MKSYADHMNHLSRLLLLWKSRRSNGAPPKRLSSTTVPVSHGPPLWKWIAHPCFSTLPLPPSLTCEQLGAWGLPLGAAVYSQPGLRSMDSDLWVLVLIPAVSNLAGMRTNKTWKLTQYWGISVELKSKQFRISRISALTIQKKSATVKF